MKTYGAVNVLIHVGGEWLASLLGRFTPQGKSPRHLLDRGLGEPLSLSRRRGDC
jgi:hypothetical protein